MAARYIPPHLRKASQQDDPVSTITDSQDNDLSSLREIEKYFWPDTEVTSSSAKSTTLHACAQTPETLTYVLLFTDANPRWGDGIIFTKSNLNLLPAHLADNTVLHLTFQGQVQADESGTESTASTSQSPIAVFAQGPRLDQSAFSRTFKFEGWYRISRLEFLEPHSPDLIRMLEQKWTLTNPRGQVRHKERSEGSWKSSLSKRWAVIKLEEDAVDKERGKPDIPKLEPEQSQKSHTTKSVNELLRELRIDSDVKGNDTKEKTSEKADKMTQDIVEEASINKVKVNAAEDRRVPSTPTLSHEPSSAS